MGERANPNAGAHRERHTHDRRRAEIIAAVRQTCVEEGVSRLSVSAITKRVGCTRSLFYHYFPDKESALDAALDSAIDSFIARLEAWNAARERGNIERALDDVIALMKSMVLEEDELSRSLASGGAGLYASFLHRVADRVATYICESTVADFARYHEVRIEHVYETFYVLITGLIMYIRAHPDTPDDVVANIAANTLHIEEHIARFRTPQGDADAQDA